MYDKLTHAVPVDTQRVLQRGGERCANLSLILARYIPIEAIQNTAAPATLNPAPRRGQMWRDYWLQSVCARFDVKENSEWRPLLENHYRRWQQMTAGAKRFSAKLQSRLIVGLGGKGPLEFGLTVQFVTGLPIIPGSAVKGIARSYALLSLAEELDIPVNDPAASQTQGAQANPKDAPLALFEAVLLASEKSRDDALKDLNESLISRQLAELSADKLWAKDKNTENKKTKAELFRLVFGSTDSSGECVFFDAVVAQLPPEGTLFEVDVMTPHFADYYSNPSVAAPHDALDPTPVNFLTVRRDTTFAFAVRSRRAATDDAVVKQAVAWLQNGLDILGAGAKTAAGYGAFVAFD
jgi:CRISPR-associated protein Cmr6